MSFRPLDESGSKSNGRPRPRTFRLQATLQPAPNCPLVSCVARTALTNRSAPATQRTEPTARPRAATVAMDQPAQLTARAARRTPTSSASPSASSSPQGQRRPSGRSSSPSVARTGSSDAQRAQVGAHGPPRRQRRSRSASPQAALHAPHQRGPRGWLGSDDSRVPTHVRHMHRAAMSDLASAVDFRGVSQWVFRSACELAS
jgi:hypothetical protein